MDQILSILRTTGLIILVVIFFNIMIFVHELGHFLAGKWRGAYIDRFQIWFGKPIWQKKIGGVRWGLGWIPAGGFVSLPQMEDMESIEGVADTPKGLKPLKALDKIIIAAAGPLFSLLLAYVFAIIVWGVGKPVTTAFDTTIGYVMPDSPAAQAGLLPGDRITAIDGQPVDKWMGNMEGVSELIAMSEHETIRFDIVRTDAAGIEQKLSIDGGYEIPETALFARSAMRRIGILPSLPAVVGRVLPGSPAEQAGIVSGQQIVAVNGTRIYTPYALQDKALTNGTVQYTLRNPDGTEVSVDVTPRVPENWNGHPEARAISGIVWAEASTELRMEHPSPQAQVRQSLKWMGDTFEKLCAPGSDIGVQHLSGPVGIGNHIYRMLNAESGIGWRLVLWFAVVLNVNLAVLNMLPLPVVDGGHVVLGFIEMIRRKPLSSRILNAVFMAFVMLLLGVFVYVTMMDIGDIVQGGTETAEQLPEPVFSAPQQ